jgi:8-oxo-dGTP pyrophosphatase MutT (NUDIX family)
MTDYNFDKKRYCNNCGLLGHEYKKCTEPITSWGIILVKIDNVSNKITDTVSNSNKITDTVSNSNKITDTVSNSNKIIDNVDIKKNKNTVHVHNISSIFIKDESELNKICTYMNSIKFLLIRRKHSLGFVEFMRGRYSKDHISGIISLFQQMTPSEIKTLECYDFEKLWIDFWNLKDEQKLTFNRKEYLESKEKFDALKNKINTELPLSFYINNVEPFYIYPEWGFPKGRKMRGESDIDCAVREFSEETCYDKNDIKILINVKPIIENIIGTNGVNYRHIYYLAEDISNKSPTMNDNNNSEIGDIGYFTYEEALNIFRKYHIEKKNITKNIFMYYLDRLTNIDYNNNKSSWTTDIDDF